MKVTVQTVVVSNINPESFADGGALEHPLVGQLLTREDGAQRFIIIGPNKDGDSDDVILENTPDELVPALFVSIGMYPMVGGDLLDGADIRVLAELPSFYTEDEAA